MTGPPEGTQEAKRRRRAMPGPLEHPDRGAVQFLLAVLAACAIWYVVARGPVPLVLGGLAIVLLGLVMVQFITGRLLLARVMAEWAPRGVRCLVIHSNSALWKEHIASHWLPRLGTRAITFNWSERAAGRGSLEHRVFAHFCAGSRNFNPAVIVFRGLARPLVFRFYYAFREAKAGRARYLEQHEREMFLALGG